VNPFILNRVMFIDLLESEKLINHKYVILEKLREELQGIDNSIYIEMDVYFYYKNEQEEDIIYHFIFANIPYKQNKVIGNPKNAIVTVEFIALEVYEK